MKRTRVMKFNSVMDYWMWLRECLLNDIYEGRRLILGKEGKC